MWRNRKENKNSLIWPNKQLLGIVSLNLASVLASLLYLEGVEAIFSHEIVLRIQHKIYLYSGKKAVTFLRIIAPDFHADISHFLKFSQTEIFFYISHVWITEISISFMPTKRPTLLDNLTK